LNRSIDLGILDLSGITKNFEGYLKIFKQRFKWSLQRFVTVYP